MAMIEQLIIEGTTSIFWQLYLETSASKRVWRFFPWELVAA